MPRNEEGPGREGNPRPRGPSARQQEILEAYLACPNAAAVGRALKTNERHVRRIVKQFGHHLDERRRQRDEERLERVRARQAKTHDWADAMLDEVLGRLDELAGSLNEGVALRAIKMKLDLALRVPSPTFMPVVPEIDRALQSMQVDLTRRIGEMELAGADEDGTDGD